jgi:hypothetical protein
LPVVVTRPSSLTLTSIMVPLVITPSYIEQQTRKQESIA